MMDTETEWNLILKTNDFTHLEFLKNVLLLPSVFWTTSQPPWCNLSNGFVDYLVFDWKRMRIYFVEISSSGIFYALIHMTELCSGVYLEQKNMYSFFFSFFLRYDLRHSMTRFVFKKKFFIKK